MGSKVKSGWADLNASTSSRLKKIINYCGSSWFDPKKSFVELPCFRVPMVVIPAISLVLYGVIAWSSFNDIESCGTGDCFNYWFTFFKVPIATLALLIPVLGLFNANHKSEQTKAAMELSKSQNNFSNYYKHIEEFLKYIDAGSQIKKGTFKDLDMRALHNKVYPGGIDGHLTIAKDIKLKYLSCLYEILNFFGRHTSFNKDAMAEMVVLVSDSRRSFASDFGVNIAYEIDPHSDEVVIGGMLYYCPQRRPVLLFSTFLFELDNLLFIFMFDTKFDDGFFHQLLRQIRRLRSLIPNSSFDGNITANEYPFERELNNIQENLNSCQEKINFLRADY